MEFMEFMEHLQFRGYDDEWGLKVLTKKKLNKFLIEF